MREIELKNGRGIALVDDGDYALLGKDRWTFHGDGYALKYEKIDGKWYGILMHRLLTNAPNGLCVDHIDGNKLNNQRANLRIVTYRQNNMNTSPRGGHSRYKGVFRAKNGWFSQIGDNGKQLYLGYFESEVDAALAYNAKALELFGEFARLNVIEETKEGAN